MPSHNRMARQWLLFNSVALFAAYVLYTPVAHGLTGSHGRVLTSPQLVAHSIALAVVALAVAAAQRHVLKQFVAVARRRVAVAAILFNIAFWLGYYQPFVTGPDTDILLGSVVLGSAVWLGNVPTQRHRVAAAIAFISFPLGNFIAQLCILAAVTIFKITPDLQSSTLQHSVYWVAVGSLTGLFGGWASGLALARMLTALPTLNSDAAQQHIPADAERPR